jgi:membrane-associated phospholipid phosphatase
MVVPVMTRSRASLVACVAARLLSSSPAAAQEPAAGPTPTVVTPPADQPTPPAPLRHPGTRLSWDRTFNRMDAPEMIFTGVAAGVALATNIIHPLKTGWAGGVLFDDKLRSLRAPTLDAQLEVRTGTDVGLAAITTFPILVDSMIVAYWYRGSSDVALQMALIDAEAFALTGAIEGTTNFLSGRARPYASECGTSVPNNTTDCSSDALYRSFFSGHTAVSFTAAGLICAHHEALHLFESAADTVTCATGLVAAATIGTLRMVGDAHYFSDVFVGSVVGTAVGLGVPLLHHYKRAEPGADSSGLSLHVVPGPTGAQIMGTF